MKYTKPEVEFLAPAAVAIETVEEKQSAVQDHITGDLGSDGPGYEADE